jgi:hypothetical protein
MNLHTQSFAAFLHWLQWIVAAGPKKDYICRCCWEGALRFQSIHTNKRPLTINPCEDKNLISTKYCFQILTEALKIAFLFSSKVTVKQSIVDNSTALHHIIVGMSPHLLEKKLSKCNIL